MLLDEIIQLLQSPSQKNWIESLKAPEPKVFALYVEKLYHHQVLLVELVIIQMGLTSKFEAEKLISIEINVKMLAYATLLLAGIAKDLSVVEVVGATLGACGVIFQSFLTSLRTGVQQGRNLVVVFDKFNLPLVHVRQFRVPPIAKKKSSRLAGSIVPHLEA